MYKSGGIIIRQSAVNVMDDKDLEFIEALRSLKVPRGVAALITYLANVSEANSREIEMGTNLRQPEVSIGMRTLRQNNWVTEHEVKVEGKGRPMKVYKLGVPIEKIIKYYEEVKTSESARAMESIQKAKGNGCHLIRRQPHHLLFFPQAHSLLNCSQVLHQEYPLVRSLPEGHGSSLSKNMQKFTIFQNSLYSDRNKQNRNKLKYDMETHCHTWVKGRLL